jgi:hypothetical protein
MTDVVPSCAAAHTGIPLAGRHPFFFGVTLAVDRQTRSCPRVRFGVNSCAR